MAVKYGPEYTFAGMDITLLENGEVKFRMKDHIEGTIDDFPEETSTSRTSPAADCVFTLSSTSQLLDSDNSKISRSIFGKFLFISYRARLDIQVPICFMGNSCYVFNSRRLG